MDKRITTISVSVLLIAAAVVIQLQLRDSGTSMDSELVGLFSGVCFGVGLMLPVSLFKKKNKS